MTRQECEAAILGKMQEIVDIYHQYNPNGKYLNLTYLDDENDGYIMCNNRHWKFEEEGGSCRVFRTMNRVASAPSCSVTLGAGGSWR